MEKMHPKKIIKFALVFIVVIFAAAAIFLNQIKSEIMNLIGIYGYIAVFFVTLIVESLAQPIGPEIPLTAGKILGLNMMYTALITITGSLIASFANYRIGKVFRKGVHKHEKAQKYVKWYKKHGKYGLLVAALGPVPYVPFCWFSGAFGLTIKKFILYGIIPRILRIVFISYVLTLVL